MFELDGYNYYVLSFDEDEVLGWCKGFNDLAKAKKVLNAQGNDFSTRYLVTDEELENRYFLDPNEVNEEELDNGYFWNDYRGKWFTI